MDEKKKQKGRQRGRRYVMMTMEEGLMGGGWTVG